MATTSADKTYTNLHLSALTFVHPPQPPEHAYRCSCQDRAPHEEKRDRSKHIRVYYNEPTGYAYNSGCYLIKESRYDTLTKWHAPNDDLVADDAAVGSPVAAVGRWIEYSQGEEERPDVYETRVYYVDKNGILRERVNITRFDPKLSDNFDKELPKPEELQVPVPGWESTPIYDAESEDDTESEDESDLGSFPAISPLSGTKLAAAITSDGTIHVFYQRSDGSIIDLASSPKGNWSGTETGTVVIEAGNAKTNTPLAVVEGGWNELRLFYTFLDGEATKLNEVYSDDHTKWTIGALPLSTIQPTVMLAAVAWNFASPYFQVRLYATSSGDDLFELVFSRQNGGWAVGDYTSITGVPDSAFPPANSSMPFSAVAAIRSACDGDTKVYFHPRRVIVAEWNVDTKAIAHGGIAKVSAGAIQRRQIEEDTRKAIKDEEERQAKIAAEQARIAAEQARIAAEQATVLPDQAELEKMPVAPPQVMKVIEEIGRCSAGYPWKRVKGGYKCEGGGHFVSDEEIRERITAKK